jgi:hypothetical protein
MLRRDTLVPILFLVLELIQICPDFDAKIHQFVVSKEERLLQTFINFRHTAVDNKNKSNQ